MKKCNVVELFAGVGGFRVGLSRVGNDFFNVIWSNQWEPATTTQHAWRTYERTFNDQCDNRDIATVPSKDIPKHHLLVGGFPCQDYSVARTLNQAQGIVGKKGVLWWQICRVIEEKGNKAPSVLFLENVDRLLISPAKQRGRDFAIILQSLADLGYIVEWRVINAAEYGFPQRRRRTYILAYREGSKIANTIREPEQWLFEDGVFAKAFPIHEKPDGINLEMHRIKQNDNDDLADITQNFNKTNSKNRSFENAGLMRDGYYWTYKSETNYSGPYTTLGDIVLGENDLELRQTITEDYYLTPNEIERWEFQKGNKKIPKVNKQGISYIYSEGSMAFPDYLDRPSRTIITSEMSKTPNRFTHIIEDPINHRYRRLVPIELERLDMFPDNHTQGESDEKRGFFMGNALVCGIVTNVGNELYRRLK